MPNLSDSQLLDRSFSAMTIFSRFNFLPSMFRLCFVANVHNYYRNNFLFWKFRAVLIAAFVVACFCGVGRTRRMVMMW